MNIKILIGIILLILTPLAAFACFFSYRSMQASSSWPSTQGVVSISRVENSVGLKTKAEILYQYLVNNETYSGSRIRFADTTGSSRSAQEKSIEPYPLGKQVEVFYDPNDPKVAVLEPGGGLRGLGLILPPLLVGGIGAFFLLDGLRIKKLAKRSVRPRQPPRGR